MYIYIHIYTYVMAHHDPAGTAMSSVMLGARVCTNSHRRFHLYICTQNRGYLTPNMTISTSFPHSKHEFPVLFERMLSCCLHIKIFIIFIYIDKFACLHVQTSRPV